VQALKAQNKTDEAALVEARFRKAWERSDLTLVASRIGRSKGAGATSENR
jgi:hypothetical protein